MSDLERIRTDAVTGRRAPRPDPLLEAVRERWAAVVGETVARHAAPVRVTGDTVVVACSSAAWSSELTLLEPAVAPRLAAAMGRELGLRFEVGEVPEPRDVQPVRTARPDPPPDAPEQARRLAAAVASDELRASLERAISRTLQG